MKRWKRVRVLMITKKLQLGAAKSITLLEPWSQVSSLMADGLTGGGPLIFTARNLLEGIMCEIFYLINHCFAALYLHLI